MDISPTCALQTRCSKHTKTARLPSKNYVLHSRIRLSMVVFGAVQEQHGRWMRSAIHARQDPTLLLQADRPPHSLNGHGAAKAQTGGNASSIWFGRFSGQYLPSFSCIYPIYIPCHLPILSWEGEIILSACSIAQFCCKLMHSPPNFWSLENGEGLSEGTFSNQARTPISKTFY
jgi:hypothetical protein